jgi:3-oxoacyl-[acyl-carrier-protein] synthase II
VKRVVVTGMSAITPIGDNWHSVKGRLETHDTAIQFMQEWERYEGLNTKLGAPVVGFEKPSHYSRKMTRSMGRGSLMATRVTELALAQAGLLDEPIVSSGAMGVAYGSSAGNPEAIADFGSMITGDSTRGLTANSYIKMMAHTAPVNLAVFFGLKGRVYTTSSACTSGSQGIGYAFEAIQQGHQLMMVAGGTEELCAPQAAVFDTLYATSTKNEDPDSTPSPFDVNRDGLVIGEGAATLVLEELEHAKARGAEIYAEVVGFGTNCDGTHITQPSKETMRISMELALQTADLKPEAIGYISAHGTATDRGDVAESQATEELFGKKTPISALKSFTGHTLGACGGIEAWLSIEMMNECWFHHTENLLQPDPECGELDYIQGEGRKIDCEYIMSNNFAFGGINTSLIFRRWS